MIGAIYFGWQWHLTNDGKFEPLVWLCGVPSLLLPILFGLLNEFKTEEKPAAPSSKADQRKDDLLTIRRAAETEELSKVMPQVLSFAKRWRRDDLAHWATLEIAGYTPDAGMRTEDKVPDYRIATGQWQDHWRRPLVPQTEAQAEVLNSFPVREGVKELEAFSYSTTDLMGIVHPGASAKIKEIFHVDVHTFMVHPINVKGLLERIRADLLRRLAEEEDTLAE
ncbi:MAG: hypothetical protein ACO1SV_06815 [Fimbriimonas sp.]